MNSVQSVSPNFGSRIKMDYTSAQKLNAEVSKFSPKLQDEFKQQLNALENNGNDDIVELSYDRPYKSHGMNMDYEDNFSLRVLDKANNKVSSLQTRKELATSECDIPDEEREKMSIADFFAATWDGAHMIAKPVDIQAMYAEAKANMRPNPNDKFNKFTSMG